MHTTKLWNRTWYDATLSEQFLDRTFANVSTLATTASVRFDDLSDDPYNEGRYYNSEGVYLGEGTCRHVSHYGQVLGRVFPALARHHREQIDFGLSLSKEGVIGYRGYKQLPKELFNGEYFIQLLDPEHLDSPNVNQGCHVDQLLGQYWSCQLGLGNIVPEETIQQSIRSILKYNFVENYDEYLAKADIPVQRWYADGNEKGVVLCTFPYGGADKAPGKVKNDWEKQVVGYFSEIFTGQEHALIATLLDLNMVDEAKKLVPERSATSG